MKAVKLFTFLALMLLMSVRANAQSSLVGDVNKDGRVNITDAMMVVDIILHGPKELSLSVNEISLDAGNSTTIVIMSGYGSFTVSSADTFIADATLSGSTVIITGKKGGTTVVKVTDTISGKVQEISVTVNGGPVSYPACLDENHPHLIDLGLPSGTKWACCNVGATKPEEYGGYYAWGETKEKSVYNQVTYQYATGVDRDGDGWYDDYQSETGFPGVWQNIGSDIAGTAYDAATANWGAPWRMPTSAEIEELVNNCSYEWTTKNGVRGGRFTGPSGSSIFLPAAGIRWYGELVRVGAYGYCWSSTPYDEYGAYGFGFDSDGALWYLWDYWYDYRYDGDSVRPVR